MGFTVSEGGNFTPAPAGTHMAICTGYADLGTQRTNYQGEEKVGRKVRLFWELCEEKRQDGSPVTTGKTYTSSLGERAALRQHLQSWRGKPFTPDELKGFDMDNIVGKPCLLTIAHNPKQGGGVSESVASVSPLLKGMKPPPQVNRSVIFQIENWDDKAFAALPAFIQKWVMESPEAKAVKGGQPVGAATDAGGEGGDEGIPF